MRIFLLLLTTLSCILSVEIHQGYTGYWITVNTTAYSPHDPNDGDYHATKGKWRWITADGKTDVRTNPYGIAVPNNRGKPWLPYGTKVIIPTGHGYLDNSKPNDRVFTVDDTGGVISKLYAKTGIPHIDLRYMTHDWARRWNNKSIRIFIVTGKAGQIDYSYRNDLFYEPSIDSK